MTFEMPDETSMQALKARIEAGGTQTKTHDAGFDFADPWQTPVSVRLRA